MLIILQNYYKRQQFHYPAISSAKHNLLIWRPNKACHSTLLDKLVTNCLLVTPEENITNNNDFAISVIQQIHRTGMISDIIGREVNG